MKAKYIAMNLALLAAIALVAWQARVRWNAAQTEREVASRVAVKSAAVTPPAALPLPEAAPAARFAEVATNDLFSRDRNPTIVIEPPKVEKPKEMPPLPVIYGVMGLPGGTRALMSERVGIPSRAVHAGDSVGEFKVVALDTRDVTFEWEGKQIARRIDSLIDRSATPTAAGIAAAPATVAAAPQPASTNPYDAQLREQAAKAGAQPAPPTSAALGVEVGSVGHSARACRPGDTAPAGTVLEGYRKILTSTPFGTNCQWAAIQ